MKNLVIGIFVMLSLPSTAKNCQWYVYAIDSTGQYVRFSDRTEAIGRYVGSEPRACDPVQTSSMPLNALSMAKYNRDKILHVTTFDVDPYIQKAGETYGVDPILIHAIIKVESDYRPSVESVKGAKGLMQLMDATASDYGVLNPFDPQQNIEGGTAFLSDLFSQFGDIDLVLAAYNAGPQRVREYNGVPPFKETKEYINRVKSLYELFKSNYVEA
ncbi:lytic transglycosylase domain-containing protein [Gammaproteobacteria bacterium]|nr:lytic transglycosylase domain-containing protein [Gammaproteobacteria bacterium]